MNENLERLNEKIDYLHALHVAGYSLTAGFLLALLRQQQLGRALTEEELQEAHALGKQSMGEMYRESLQIFQAAKENSSSPIRTT